MTTNSGQAQLGAAPRTIFSHSLSFNTGGPGYSVISIRQSSAGDPLHDGDVDLLKCVLPLADRLLLIQEQ